MWCILYVGKVMEHYFILLFILSSLTFPALSTDEVQATTPPSIYDNEQPEPSSDDIPEITTHRKTITELVNEQTEAIMKIISAHKLPESDYPIVTKQEADVKHKIPPAPMKEIIEQETIDTLKVKCEHLAKLQKNEIDQLILTPQSVLSDEVDNSERFVSPVSQSLITERTTEVSQVIQNQSPYPYVIPLRSDYRQRLQPQKKHPQGFYIVNNNQNQSVQKDKLTPAASNINQQYFYSTVPPTTTTVPLTPSLSAQAGSINQNYIKMEPVVLQRTMLTNGNMLFYWYRPLRNMQNPELVGYNYQNHQENLVGQGNQYGGQYYPFYPMRRKEELPTTTTTTERSPQIEIDYGSQEQDNNLYRSQYRFIMPMAYKPPDTVEPDSPQFDQYAYLPEHLRPTLMNVQLPYVPTYHMIKAIAVPKREEAGGYREEGMYGHKLTGDGNISE